MNGLSKQQTLWLCERAEPALLRIRDGWSRAVATSALQTMQAWAHGEATLDDVRAAYSVLLEAIRRAML